jgi:hypothetical protein
MRAGHKRVEGWLLPGAMRMIAACAGAQTVRGVHGHVGEIGVHHGKLFVFLYLLKAADEKAVAVDLFDQQENNVDGSGRGDLGKLTANLQRHAGRKDFMSCATDSRKITGGELIEKAGGKFRLFSLDGGHSAAVTAHDLGLAEAALAPGGIIILDDYFNETWPEVSAGTVKYFDTPRGIAPFAIGANKILFCHPDYAGSYSEAVKLNCPGYVERDFLGARVVCCDFSKPALAVRVGQHGWWKLLRETPPGRMLRALYRALRPLLR